MAQALRSGGPVFSKDDPEVAKSASRFDAKARAAIEEDGFCVIPEVLNSEQLAALRARLDEQATGEQSVRRALQPTEVAGDAVPTFLLDGETVEADGAIFQQGGTADQRVAALLNKGSVFRQLAIHPLAMTIAREMLGEPFLLSNCSANIARTPKSAQVIHSDQHYIPAPQPSYPLGVNVFWLLDEYTAHNGATRFVPGSHLWGDKTLHDPDEVESIPAIAPAGSVVAFDPRLLHGAGGNETSTPRRAIVSHYIRFFLRQTENYSLQLSDEARADLTPELREVLGLRVHSILGGVDGHYGVAATQADTRGDAEKEGIGGFYVDRPRQPTRPLAADGTPISG